MQAALGFRPHTYWTAAVALAGPAAAPRLIARRRIEFAAGEERMAYHHAAEVGPDRAEAWIEGVRAATGRKAADAIGGLLAELARDGYAVDTAAVPQSRASLPPLGDILKVHALMHAAEGVLYREVVAAACRDVGLAVASCLERDLPARAAEALNLSRPALEAELADLAAGQGPPWNEDYRLAALAAWLALTGRAETAAAAEEGPPRDAPWI